MLALISPSVLAVGSSLKVGSSVVGTVNGISVQTIKYISSDSQVYNAGTDAPVHGICDDGTTAYWITNTATKKTVYKKPLTGDATNTADVVTMFDEVGLISNAVMEFVKERIVMCADNKVYMLLSRYSLKICLYL